MNVIRSNGHNMKVLLRGSKIIAEIKKIIDRRKIAFYTCPAMFNEEKQLYDYSVVVSL